MATPSIAEKEIKSEIGTYELIESDLNSQYLNRPSIKVRQQPGGSSGYNFITGESADNTQQSYGRNQPVQRQEVVSPQSRSRPGKASQEVTGKIGAGAYSSNDYNPPMQRNGHQSNEQSKQEYTALYCTEGNQVRNKPSVRVAAQKKDQITF